MRVSPRRVSRILAAVSAIAAPAALSHAQAQTTWIGPSGGSWSVGANWSGGVVPNEFLDVHIDGSPAATSVIASETAFFNSLRIDPGDTLSFRGNAAFVSTGSLISNGGTIRFAPDAGVGQITIFPTHDITFVGGGIVSVERPVVYGNSASLRLINLDNTIRGVFDVYGSLENHATIISEGGVMWAGVWSGSVVRNTGYMGAASGSSITFWDLDNAGGVVEAQDGGTITLMYSVRGGILKTLGSGVIVKTTTYSEVTLSDLVLDASYTFGSVTTFGESVTQLVGTIENRGTITVAPPSGKFATLKIGANTGVVLSGGGTVRLVGSGARLGGLGNSGPLISDNTIRGFGDIIGVNLQSSGEIVAEGGGLRIFGRTKSTGSVVVEPGAKMTISWLDSPAGAVRVLQNGSMVMSSSASHATGSIELDGQLHFSNGSLTAAAIAGGGAIIQSGGQIAAQHLRIGSASISAGSTKISAGGGTSGTNRLNSLSVTGAGILDLTDHDLILDYAPEAPIDPQNIRTMLASAYAGGAWTGPGLTSSSAGGSSNPKTALGYLDNSDGEFTEFSGQDVDDSSILIQYTLAGDANLDQRVDVNDLVALAGNWQMPGVWDQGDFDYDGFVGKSDLGLLAGNWHGDLEDALLGVGLGGVSVPEPGAMAGVLGLVCPLLCRRRRGG